MKPSAPGLQWEAVQLPSRLLTLVGALVLTGTLACAGALPSTGKARTDISTSDGSTNQEPAQAAPAPLEDGHLEDGTLEDGTQRGDSQAVLRWQATQEKYTYGYLVYRSQERQGPFLRLGKEIVRAKGGEGVNGYEFIDRDVIPGRTYYYYLDQISLNGIKSRFSGVLAKVVEAVEPAESTP